MDQHHEHCNDINLYELWQSIVKRKRLIICLCLTAVFLSCLHIFLSPTIYRGYSIFVILTPDVVTPKEIVDSLGNIDHEKRRLFLHKTHPDVTNVKIEALKDSKNKIVVTVDSKRVNNIQLALSETFNYINNIEIINRRLELEKEILRRKKVELAAFIESSTVLIETYDKLFKTGKISTVGFNPTDMRRAVVNAKIELLQVEQMLLRLSKGDLELFMQPNISSDPVSQKSFRTIGLAGISGLFFGICMAILMEYAGKGKNERGHIAVPDRKKNT